MSPTSNPAPRRRRAAAASDDDEEEEDEGKRLRDAEAAYASHTSRSTYLKKILAASATETDATADSGEGEHGECPVCLSEDEPKLALPPCAHIMCAPCSRDLLKVARGSAHCPVCRGSFTSASLVLCTRKAKRPQTADAAMAEVKEQVIETPARPFDALPLTSSYGTKMDTIVRHIKHLRATEAGAKVLVFSQWQDVLRVVESALRTNGIGCVTLHGSRAKSTNAITKFNQDSSIAAFLLDAKSASAGLTLVAATTVFFMEPLLNPAVELQAIGRVHRIGQTRTTQVVKYIMTDTVEESVLRLSDERKSAIQDALVKEEKAEQGLGLVDMAKILGLDPPPGCVVKAIAA
mmetsp:Transcript_14945/g.35149  ORF Transcript_14945/g.35149 Transcript_14945/m.35149 type:complete len:349 (+) Transcript_14945:460-1506(+)